jgi:hypothetical protein
VITLSACRVCVYIVGSCADIGTEGDIGNI